MPSTYNHQLYGVFRALNKKYADRIVVVSNAVLKAYGSGDKIAQIYDSYPIHEKYPAFIVSPDKPLRFLYLSNYIQGKGHDLAIKAFAVFNKTNRKGELHLHGSTMNLAKNESYKTYLQKLGDELGLSGKIFFNGFSQDVEKIYKAHDVSLMFSESESFSMICYESMTFGVPVIASDCGGPAEIVEHKKNGLLVTNKDVNDMAQAMQYLYDNYEERKKFSEKGREKINEMIHSNGDFFSLVEELLNESKK
jgi:glycosyltransferase involved in cell wall biosynthesis